MSNGTYSISSGTTYEAENGSLSGNATLMSGSFSGGRAVGYLGKGGTVTINNVQGAGRDQWVALYYANGECIYVVHGLEGSSPYPNGIYTAR